MKDISIPFHLAIPTFISLIAIVLILSKKKILFNSPKRKTFFGSLLFFFIFYLFVVGSAMCQDLYYQWDLNSYDLDHDGFFAGSEVTTEQKAAMFRLTSGIGRDFSFVYGFIYSLIASVVFFILWRTFLFLHGRFLGKGML